MGGRLVADLLATAGATRVLTMALHSERVHGFFSVPVDHLTALPVLADHYRGRDLSNTVVVSPDFGNAKDAGRFARSGRRVATRLQAAPGRRHGRHRRHRGRRGRKDCIVLDDETSGGSIVTLIDALCDYGVNSISVATTHGLFTGNAVERLGAVEAIDEIVTTNTVPRTSPVEKLRVLSVAPLFARRCGASTSASRSARCSPRRTPRE